MKLDARRKKTMVGEKRERERGKETMVREKREKEGKMEGVEGGMKQMTSSFTCHKFTLLKRVQTMHWVYWVERKNKDSSSLFLSSLSLSFSILSFSSSLLSSSLFLIFSKCCPIPSKSCSTILMTVGTKRREILGRRRERRREEERKREREEEERWRRIGLGRRKIGIDENSESFYLRKLCHCLHAWLMRV